MIEEVTDKLQLLSQLEHRGARRPVVSRRLSIAAAISSDLARYRARDSETTSEMGRIWPFLTRSGSGYDRIKLSDSTFNFAPVGRTGEEH